MRNDMKVEVIWDGFNIAVNSTFTKRRYVQNLGTE